MNNSTGEHKIISTGRVVNQKTSLIQLRFTLHVNDRFSNPLIHVYLNSWNPWRPFIHLNAEMLTYPSWAEPPCVIIIGNTPPPSSLGNELSYVVVIAGYFLHLGMLNQLITLSHQLNSDAFNLTNHKYMAHQTALLYVRYFPLFI